MAFDDTLRELLREVDEACHRANQQGMSGRMIAGTLLARVQHWYILQDPADIKGLEELLEYGLKQLRDRPSWDID